MIENSLLQLDDAQGLKCGDGLNWYIYANNNPLKFVDPTGLSEIYADDIHGNPIVAYEGRDLKAETTVEVNRDSSEGYFNDTLDVKIGNQTLTRIAVQGEATRDDPADLHDGTLEAGEYDLTLLPEEFSPSYIDGMSITGNGIESSYRYMVHPNEITNPANVSKYGTVYNPPDSTGCIVTNGASDFSRIRGDLEGVGFNDWESVDLKIKDITGMTQVQNPNSSKEPTSGKYVYPF